MRPKGTPSPSAIRDYLDQNPGVLVIYYRLAIEDTAHGLDYLHEVVDTTGAAFVPYDEDDGETPNMLRTLRDVLLLPVRPPFRVLVSDAMLSRLQNSEQAFHNRMVNIKYIRDNGDLGCVYVDGVEDKIVKVGRKYVTTESGGVFDFSGNEKRGHRYAYFSRYAAEQGRLNA